MQKDNCVDRHCYRCKIKLIIENWCKSNRKHKLYQCNNCTRIIYRTWQRKNIINSYKDGHNIEIKCKKRDYPKENKCELCGLEKQLGYHHWNDSQPSLGMWICHSCHYSAESVERYLRNPEFTKIYLVKRKEVEHE